MLAQEFIRHKRDHESPARALQRCQPMNVIETIVDLSPEHSEAAIRTALADLCHPAAAASSWN